MIEMVSSDGLISGPSKSFGTLMVPERSGARRLFFKHQMLFQAGEMCCVHVSAPSPVSTYFHCIEAKTNGTDLSPVTHAVNKLMLMLIRRKVAVRWCFYYYFLFVWQLINQAEIGCWKRFRKVLQQLAAPPARHTRPPSTALSTLPKVERINSLEPNLDETITLSARHCQHNTHPSTSPMSLFIWTDLHSERRIFICRWHFLPHPADESRGLILAITKDSMMAATTSRSATNNRNSDPSKTHVRAREQSLCIFSNTASLQR